MLLGLTQIWGTYEVAARREGVTGVTDFLQTYQSFFVPSGYDAPDRSMNGT